MQRKCVVFFFKQKTAYEMRISDWSSDVCSSDLPDALRTELVAVGERRWSLVEEELEVGLRSLAVPVRDREGQVLAALNVATFSDAHRSEEHTSELQSLMRISYAVFCLKKKKHKNNISRQTQIIEQPMTEQSSEERHE